jgi:hypothetical protein
MAEMLATQVVGGFTAGNLLSAGGTLMQLFGGMDQADNMRRAAAQNAENARITAEANKKQLDYQAGQEEAAGQHQAEAARRKAALMLSRATAVAAASGAGGLDESLIKGITGEGEREAGFASYGSRERAAGLRYRGDVGTYEANAKGRQGIDEANRMADATIMGSLGKAGFGLMALAPGKPPGIGDGLDLYNRYQP